MRTAKLAVNIVLISASLSVFVFYVLAAAAVRRNITAGMPEDIRFEVHLGSIEVLLLGVSIIGIVVCFTSPYWFAVGRAGRILLLLPIVPAVPFFIVHYVHWSRVWGLCPQLSMLAPIRFGADLPCLWLAHLLAVMPVSVSGSGYPRLAKRLWIRLRRKHGQVQPWSGSNAATPTDGKDRETE